MKNSTSLLLFGGATFLAGLIASIAQAGPTTTAQMPATERVAHRAAIRATYDLDRDGRLDAAERAALRADIAAGKIDGSRRAHRFDRNRCADQTAAGAVQS